MDFGCLKDGTHARLYRIKNANGIEMALTDLGGIIVELKIPDKNGQMADIVLGYECAEDYLRDDAHMGAVAGRYAGRIRGAMFSLDGEVYHLNKNVGAHHLHGGFEGFNRKLWAAEPFSGPGHRGIRFSITSNDGDEGYPGTLHATITYTLGDDNSLSVDFDATSDKATVVNLTQHSYFNLSGDASRTVNDHTLQINAARVLESDSDLLPTGGFASILGTPMDFTSPKLIGHDINAPFPMLQNAGGYDHTYVLSDHLHEKPSLAARLVHPESGRKALYVNPGHTRTFEGWTSKESRPLLDFLYAHVDQPEFTCRFNWEPGSVTLWDNRCTWHTAANDYQGQARLMHRITLQGSALSGV